jgi:effector-binding domain-containing protein
MIDTPLIVQSAAQITAVIKITVPRNEIQKVMGPAIQEVMKTVAEQGIGPAGSVYAYHFRITPELFDFEVGVPVTAPVSPTGRVQASQIPSTMVARTVYHGPYDGLGAAWGEFGAWITANGHQATGGLWERYIAGPESNPDAATWQTELNEPVAA